MEWELCPKGTGHRSLAAAEATARWLNSQKQGKRRYLYRGTTTADGRHVLERTANPDAEQRTAATR